MKALALYRRLAALPQKDCGMCGCENCVSFSFKVEKGELPMSKCPHLPGNEQQTNTPPSDLNVIGALYTSDSGFNSAPQGTVEGLQPCSKTMTNITDYLKTAVATESLLFRLNTLKRNAEQFKGTLQGKVLEKPEKRRISPPAAPDTSFNSSLKAGAIFAWVVGIISLLLGLSITDADFKLILIIAGIILLPLGVLFWKAHRKEEQAYAKALQKYNSDVENERNRYNQSLQEAKEKTAEIQERAKSVEDEILLIEQQSDETQKVLSDLYSLDVIFPKYRNFPAMCTIYEYFASGRCDELSGPNGAYNLYESELRQNIIINQLDTIMDRLDSLRQNQFVLYSELKKVSDLMPVFSSSIEQIQISSAIAAQCAEAAAQNTETIKYLALIR